jgi:hypothetical protein
MQISIEHMIEMDESLRYAGSIMVFPLIRSRRGTSGRFDFQLTGEYARQYMN